MGIEMIQPGERQRGTMTSSCGDPVLISANIFVNNTQNAVSNTGRICEVSNSSWGDKIGIIFDTDTTGPRLRCQVNGASGSTLTTTIMDTGTAIQGAWQHVLLLAESNGVVRAWVNGVNELDTTTTATDFTAINRYCMGSRYSGTTQEQDCEVEGFTVWTGGTVWSVADGATVAAFLANGGNPWLIEPDKIICAVNGYYDKEDIFKGATAAVGTPDLTPIANPIQGPR